MRKAVLRDSTLTLEQYRVADARNLDGSGLTNSSAEPMPIAYDGPHQVRWGPSSWHGFTRMSKSGRVNNANDTHVGWSTTDYTWAGSDVGDDVVADEDVFNGWDGDAYWSDTRDRYDVMSDRFCGTDLTEDGCLRQWSPAPPSAYINSGYQGL